MNRREFIGVGSSASLLRATGFAIQGEAKESAEGEPVLHKLPVKAYSRFARLPPGSVAPSGWLLQYAQVNADSWILDYARHRDPGVYSEYSRRSKTPYPVFNENNETVDFCGYIAYFGSALVHY